MTDQRQAERPSQGRRIQVVIREEDMDDVTAQGRGGANFILPEDTDVVEGQIYILQRPKPGDQVDDTEGQGRISVNRMGETEEDVEGQGGRYTGRLEPATPEDVAGQGKFNWLRETDEDIEGQGSRWTLEPDDDTEGHGRGGVNG